MCQDLPDIDRLWQAIDLYMAHAYSGPAPRAIQQRLEQVRQCGGDLCDCPAFERNTVGNGQRISLRLGNRHYPHMKLSIDRAPDGSGCLFRADTHDRHLAVAPGSGEQQQLRELVEHNQRLAQEIEADWEAHGLPTFKTFLRDDLARRRTAAEE